jgi:PIN domain nuclease of toxin-antitoxin system
LTLLLDTHAWLWFANDDVGRLGRRALQTVSRAQTGDAVRISTASLFEIVALHTLGRLRFAVPPEQWVADALAVPGLRIAELSPAIAVDAALIPRTALADPMDRFLVATARRLDATLVTADRRILEYAAETHRVQAQDASR